MNNQQYSLRRSALYMPALNDRAMDKARNINCDVILFDLEDSVAPVAKAEARTKLVQQLNHGGYGNRELVIRINGRETSFWDDDLEILKHCNPDAVLIPKVNNSVDVCATLKAINNYSNRTDIGLWLMMETPLAVLNANQIGEVALQYDQLQGYVIGTNDLVKDTGVHAGNNRALLWSWLMTIVASAKSYGLDVIDGVYNNPSDQEGFQREAQQGRDMGMTGKSLIHPNQVEITNLIFSPKAEEIEYAQKIVLAFEQESSKGKGVITVDGKMVERLHLKMAQDTLEKVKVIAANKAS